MKKIAVINGPNLNLIGTREPEIYGNESLTDYIAKLGSQHECELISFQSNSEGELVDAIQSHGNLDGIILNAAAYTHTSVAIRDAIASIDADVVEVHISNIYAREEFRSKSLTAPVCKGMISGLGLKGYELALRFFL